ncbi:MAG: nuclear transport factor 2 family protein [Kamptonema sp. SIO4C4]|nr:nuclear transport factor 2 family protein [Kamptonema sp. SIO4C4]
MFATAPQSPTPVKEQFHPLVARYFESLNQEDFLGVSQLFAPEGCLLPPFEEEIIGPTAIARYLYKEARGMKFVPHKVADVQRRADGTSQSQIVGKAHSPLFSVHVAWTFTFTNKQTLQQLSVKLLASPEELLKLQSQAN